MKKTSVFLILIYLVLAAACAFAESGTWQVSQSTDDGRVLDTTWSSSGTSDYFGNQNIFGTCSAALRFETDVPKGAIIKTAYLILNASSVQAGLSATCYGIDEDDAATFSADPFARDHTTASASCDYADWSAASGWSNSSSLVAVVQEIVSRGGFGGAIGFFLEDDSSPSANVFNFYTWDYGGGASEFAPKLYIEWAVPATISGSPGMGR